MSERKTRVWLYVLLAILAAIVVALWVFADYMDRVVKVKNAGSAPSIMAAHSYDSNLPPTLVAQPRTAEAPTPLAVLMAPRETSYVQKFHRLASSKSLADKKQAYELVKQCMLTSLAKQQGYAGIDLDCGDLETGQPAIVQDPSMRLKPLTECARGGEPGCWALMDQWEGARNGVFGGLTNSPEHRALLEEARQASIARGDPAALFNESARAQIAKDQATALEMYAAGREANRLINKEEKPYMPFNDTHTIQLAQGLPASVVRERIERGITKARVANKEPS